MKYDTVRGWHLPMPCDVPTGTKIRFITEDHRTIERELLEPARLSHQGHEGIVHAKSGGMIHYTESGVGSGRTQGLFVHTLLLPVAEEAVVTPNPETKPEAPPRDVYADHRQKEQYDLAVKVTVDQIQANASAYSRTCRALELEKPRVVPYPHEIRSERTLRQG